MPKVTPEITASIREIQANSRIHGYNDFFSAMLLMALNEYGAEGHAEDVLLIIQNAETKMKVMGFVS